MSRDVTTRHPKAYFVINLIGFDDDPRELWEFRDVRLYVRWWARLCSLDDIVKAAPRLVSAGP
jgi:hypothetical protein